MKQPYYKTWFKTVVKNDVIDERTNGITFINNAPTLGGTNVIVETMILEPGQSFSINDSTGALDITKYKVRFDATTGSVNRLIVVFKRYQ